MPTQVNPGTARTRVTTADRTVARRAGIALALAAVLAVAGFTALGSVFDYPQILHEPTSDILVLFRSRQTAVMAWFGVLVVSAGLLAPAGIWLGRLTGGRRGRAIAVVGIAAAVVQVLGLQRWLTMVPGFSRAALVPGREAEAAEQFRFWHTILGTVVGETLGYALTAVFTVLVVRGLGGILPRWLAAVGYVAAVLIATGIMVPAVREASLTNFAGYVLWCLWLLALAVTLFRVSERPAPDHGARPAT